MNYKGSYSGDTTYAVGDVVVYTDNVAYVMTQEATAGTTPHDVRRWSRVIQPYQEIVMMFHGTFGGIDNTVEEVAARIPGNISDDAISLKGSEDNEYLITVDDSGETPELSVTLIEEEEEEET